MNNNKCVECGKKFIFINTVDSELEGYYNVYSEYGVKETQISGLCELCFDSLTGEYDEDDDYFYEGI